MKDLLLSIYNCNNYDEVFSLVHSHPLLSNPENWTPYGNNYNNCGTFENQQAKPETALVEKLTNSIDAILTKECLIRGIDPKSDSPEVPQTMTEAIEKFFGVIKGKWENAVATERKNVASRLQVILTGDRQTPNVTIYDNGEGQIAKEFPNTFLSLHKGNKMSIPFVQGKFNMGSTGAVLFCGGDEKYQLIVSRRCKELCNENEHTFGFTLVRKHPLSAEEEINAKSTWYEYFTINGEIPSFYADSLNLSLDGDLPFVDGTVIKMFSYELSRGCQSDATLDLWRELNTLLYDSSLPILICEQRDFKGHSKEKVMLGNKTRISIDDRDKKYQTLSYAIKDVATFGAEIPIEVTIFKSDVKNPEFIRGRSVIFMLNGQTQGFEGKTFISMELGFRQLREYMLVSVDCTNIKASVRNNIFMSSRDRMREGKYYSLIKEKLIALLKNDDVLKQLNQEYKGKELLESKDDKDLIQNIFQHFKGNDNIKKLLSNVKGLYSFSNSPTTKQQDKTASDDKKDKKKIETPNLSRYPSYFQVSSLKEKDGKMYKAVSLGGKGSIVFKTDAENEFLTRNIDKGDLEISILNFSNQGQGGGITPPIPSVPDDKLIVSRSGPHDGEIRLSFEPTDKAQAGDMFEISAKMISSAGEIEVVVFVGIEKEKEQKEKTSEKEDAPNFNLPQMIRVFKEKTEEDTPTWEECTPPMTAKDVVQLTAGDNGAIEEIRINMDSNLMKKQVNRQGVSVEKVGKKYVANVYSHALILYSTLFGYYSNESNENLPDRNAMAMITDDLNEAISTIFQHYGSFLMDFSETDLTDE